MKLYLFIFSLMAFIGLAIVARADDNSFHPGPVFKNFGKIATIDSDMPLSKDTKFKVVFDVSKPGKTGQMNRSLVTAARFVNMHVEAGVAQENIKIAIVVHGGASVDVTRNDLYGKKRQGAVNTNISAIKELTEKGVQIYLCGQSATYHGIKKTDLLPNVKMALSAMTAHALLQQQGYTLNPF
ncbi:MAG: DsrE family protein [Alphaproteobacteria bacterium]|nr:DsrE family protein [Alphaproteobacteria bacterium]